MILEKITAAITAKYLWLVIACDGCGTVVDLDLRAKPRDSEACVGVALKDVRCPLAMALVARVSSRWRDSTVDLKP